MVKGDIRVSNAYESYVIKNVNVPSDGEILAQDIKRIQNIPKVNLINRKKQIEEARKFIEYFKNNKIDSKDKEKIEYLENKIKKIYDLEIEDLEREFGKDITLNIDREEDDDVEGNYYDNESITIYTKKIIEDLEDDDIDVRIDACLELIHTIFHEIQHHRQYLMATSNVCSKEAMMYAKEYALSHLLEDKFYEDNYEELGIESDADEVAEKRKIQTIAVETPFIYEKIRNYLAKYSRHFYADEIVQRDSKNNQKVYDIVKQQGRVVVEELLDDLIYNEDHLEVLEEFPILNKVYNKKENGLKKNVKVLVKEMKEEIEKIKFNKLIPEKTKEKAIQDLEDMYFEIIYNALEKYSQYEIDRSNKEEIKEVLTKMEERFENQLEEDIEKGIEYIKLTNEEQIENTPEILRKPRELLKRITEKVEIRRFKKDYKKDFLEKKKNIESIKTGKAISVKKKVRVVAMQKVRPVTRVIKEIEENIKNKFKEEEIETKAFNKDFKQELSIENYENKEEEQINNNEKEFKIEIIRKDDETR